MVAHQQEPQSEKWQMQKRLAFLMIIVLPMLGGAIIWILNIQGVITGPWSNICSVLFTVIGVLVAFLQWSQQSPIKTPLDSVHLSMPQQQMPNVQLKETNLGVNRRKGDLIVKVKKKLVGSTITLSCGFDNHAPSADVASNVVLRRVNGFSTAVAVFPALEPGNYTVSLHATELRTNVTIRAGHIEEIDWQQRSGKL